MNILCCGLTDSRYQKTLRNKLYYNKVQTQPSHPTNPMKTINRLINSINLTQNHITMDGKQTEGGQLGIVVFSWPALILTTSPWTVNKLKVVGQLGTVHGLPLPPPRSGQQSYTEEHHRFYLYNIIYSNSSNIFQVFLWPSLNSSLQGLK